MKHLKQFKLFEAVIIPSEIKKFDGEIRSFEDALRFGEENDFDVVDYDTFYNSLDERNRKTAPPRHGVPFFALFHPINKKPMFVISDPNIIRNMPNFKEIITDIIGHEKVHQEQVNRKGSAVYTLPNPMDRKGYFSNKDETMAFSWTIANALFKRNDSIQDAIKDLDAEMIRPMIDPHMARRGPRDGMMPPMGPPMPQDKMMWADIKRNCDEKAIKRYRKYIYMYLDKMFDE